MDKDQSRTEARSQVGQGKDPKKVRTKIRVGKIIVGRGYEQSLAGPGSEQARGKDHSRPRAIIRKGQGKGQSRAEAKIKIFA